MRKFRDRRHTGGNVEILGLGVHLAGGNQNLLGDIAQRTKCCVEVFLFGASCLVGNGSVELWSSDR
jgi:hypothetical protein